MKGLNQQGPRLEETGLGKGLQRDSRAPFILLEPRNSPVVNHLCNS